MAMRNNFEHYKSGDEESFLNLSLTAEKKNTYPTSNNWNIQWSTRKMDELKSIMTQMLAQQKRQELQLQQQKTDMSNKRNNKNYNYNNIGTNWSDNPN